MILLDQVNYLTVNFSGQDYNKLINRRKFDFRTLTVSVRHFWDFAADARLLKPLAIWGHSLGDGGVSSTLAYFQKVCSRGAATVCPAGETNVHGLFMQNIWGSLVQMA